MAAITWPDVTNFAPELATINATAQTDILAVVNVRLAVSTFDGEAGATTRIARILLAAHLATLTKLGATGPLIAEQLGPLSQQYAAPFLARSQLATTSDGAAFLALLPPSVHGPQVL